MLAFDTFSFLKPFSFCMFSFLKMFSCDVTYAGLTRSKSYASWPPEGSCNSLHAFFSIRANQCMFSSPFVQISACFLHHSCKSVHAFFTIRANQCTLSSPFVQISACFLLHRGYTESPVCKTVIIIIDGLCARLLLLLLMACVQDCYCYY